MPPLQPNSSVLNYEDSLSLWKIASQKKMKNSLNGIGQKLKAVRTEREMTLQDLADLTGITRSMLSQIETNKSLPSLTTLELVSRALGLPMGSFFESTLQQGSPILKKRDRRRLQTKNGVTFYSLTPNISSHRLEVLYNVYERNGSTGPLYSHQGEECGILLKGRLEVTWDDKVHILEEGDTIYLDSSKPHSMKNLFDGETIAIWINTPPTW
jgi:transcriptional regulator with XRE-family HTH domain